MLAGLDAVEAGLELYARAQRRRGFSFWAIVESATGLLVGDVGFGVLQQTGDVELGYTLARAVWGRGFATEAAGACLEAGLAQLGVRRIVARVDEANERSHRVAERIGMTRIETVTAHSRPHALYERVARSSEL